jgi:hypothetical protein
MPTELEIGRGPLPNLLPAAEDSRYAPLFALLVQTRLRPGEALAPRLEVMEPRVEIRIRTRRPDSGTQPSIWSHEPGEQGRSQHECCQRHRNREHREGYDQGTLARPTEVQQRSCRPGEHEAQQDEQRPGRWYLHGEERRARPRIGRPSGRTRCGDVPRRSAKGSPLLADRRSAPVDRPTGERLEILHEPGGYADPIGPFQRSRPRTG